MKKLTPANCLTMFRLLGSAALLFVEPLSIPFYILYSLCGVSDALDGPIARRTKTSGDFGARLDSVADIVFYAVMLCRLLPVLWRESVLPRWCWYWAEGILLFRIGVYIFALVKFRRFPSLHTMLNKTTGLLLFAAAFVVRAPFAEGYFVVVCVVATLAGAEELTIHLYNPRYGGECLSLWALIKEKYHDYKKQ